MEIKKFIERNPFLYHLTANENLPLILRHGKIMSTNYLIDISKKDHYQPIKRERRTNHVIIEIENDNYYIRDQQPISEKALKKCLTNNWTPADFYEHLNNRVFTWPNVCRLERHFNRYEEENPVILKLNTVEVFNLNAEPLFSRLNSGATRANSYLGGKPPVRGIDTFLPSEKYLNSLSSVAEVTFERELILPAKFELIYSPAGEGNVIEL